MKTKPTALLRFWLLSAVCCLLASSARAQYNYSLNYQTNTITVASNWVGSQYVVGDYTFLNALIIKNGGVLSDGFAYLGKNLGGSNNAAIVFGTGSVWSNQANLHVGTFDAGNSLTISNGGKVFNGYGFVGYDTSSSNNSVLATCNGSVWSNSNDLTIGNSASGNSLTISNGGVVFNGLGYVGYNATSSNNSVLVSSGGVWSHRYDLYVGYSGAGNSLTISNGGAAINGFGFVGDNYSSSNNSVVVTGPGSVWSNRSYLIVGNDGSGNSLVVSNGSVVFNGNGILGASSLSRSNSVLVTGNGSVWSNSNDLTIGNYAWGNSLTISNGGKVFNGLGYMGYSSFSNSVLVTGTGSVWSNRNDLNIGYTGVSNSLTIASGGAVFNATGNIGSNTTAAGNSVVVTGSGGVWSNRNDLFVGDYGAGNSLTISNGGAVVNGTGYVGYNASSSNNSVLVNGTGSAWSNANNLIVGFHGAGNSLTISNGGKVFNGSEGSVGGWISFGEPPTASNNSVLVTGTGSVWSNGALSVGYTGAGNSLTISNGGTVFSDIGNVGLDYSSSNNSVLVTGSGSVWSNRNDLTIGDYGWGCSLTISNGGAVFNGNGSVGGQNANGSSDTNRVVVTGSGSVWSNRNDLYLGRDPFASGNYSLTTSNGGLVVAQNVYVGQYDPGSTLKLAGGTNVFSGTMSVGDQAHATGAVWVTDSSAQLVVTNAISFTYIGKSGVGQMAVSNGAWLASNVDVGDLTGSKGTLTVAGGTSGISGFLNVGVNNNATGAVWVTGGQSVATNATAAFGVSGSGRMAISNGTVLADQVFVSVLTGSKGTLTVAGGDMIIATNQADFADPGSGGGMLAVRSGVLTVGSGGNVTATNLSLGYSAGSKATVTVNGGGVTVLDTTLVGTHGGSASLINNGGLLSNNIVEIGATLGSAGTLTMNGGQLNLTGHNFYGALMVGLSGDGTLNLSGTALITNVAGIAVGINGNGTINQSGGKVFLAPGYGLGLGNEVSGVGTYTMSGNSSLVLTGGNIQVGYQGTGKFIQNSGNVLLAAPDGNSGHIFIANAVGSVGAYTISAGSLTGTSVTVGGDVSSAGGTGVLTVNGGTVKGGLVIWHDGTVNLGGTGRIDVGSDPLADNIRNDGQFNISGGTLIVGGRIYGIGQILQTGGNMHFDQVYVDLSDISIEGGTATADGNMVVGKNTSTPGILNMSGGSLTATSGVFGVGNNGTLTGGSGEGHVSVSGGTLTASTIILGSSTGGSGDMTVSGTGHVKVTGGFSQNDLTVDAGTFEVIAGPPPEGEDPMLNNAIVGGYLRDGALTVNGGHVSAPIIKDGVTLGNTGTVTVNGGVVSADTFLATNGTGSVFTFNGGTVNIHTSIFATASAVVVGDGTHAATLNLLAGTHSFADGLVVSAGATISAVGSTLHDGGFFTNAGTFVQSHVTATFEGPVVNAGMWMSDPSTNIFASTYLNPTNGVIQMGSGDTYIFHQDFINQSASNTAYNTSQGIFVFAGSGTTTQTMQVAGLSLGGYGSTYGDPTNALFLGSEQFSTNSFVFNGTNSVWGLSNNFTLGTIEITNTALVLADSFPDDGLTAGLYVASLTLDPGGHLFISNNVQLYFEATNGVTSVQYGGLAWNGTAQVWVENGAGFHEFTIVPEPSVLLLGLGGAVALYARRRRTGATQTRNGAGKGAEAEG